MTVSSKLMRKITVKGRKSEKDYNAKLSEARIGLAIARYETVNEKLLGYRVDPRFDLYPFCGGI